MRFHAPLLLALTAIAQATPIANDLLKRDGAAVIDAVTTISESLITLNNTVTSYRGGILGTITALKIEFQSIALSNDLRAAIRTTTDSADFTEDESLHVSAAFIDLQPNIFTTLDNIVFKKPQFDNGLLGIGSLAFGEADGYVCGYCAVVECADCGEV
ncbi:hydrophobic surface binding protein A-domain-containing protein [Aspergillus karnatakaensis]|uniref:cell wall mannoprotein 1 family protein n=1 Tax=Aspergillus karnatakaensis TaxID=1810916 RepID=UPI003CCE2B61